MRTKSIERFAELTCCNSLEAWCDLVFRLGTAFGYEQTRLAILPDPDMPREAEYAFQHGNYDPEWISKYTAAKMHYFDPTFIHCATKSTPLVWTPKIFSRSKHQKEMYEEACGYGIRSGVTLPIHGPNAELGILCFVTDRRPDNKFDREVCSSLPELSYLRDVIFETSLPFMKPAQPQINLAPLTPRELECVKWCAVGKSSWDISQILHCSEAAVNFHFANLRRKFSVKSRQQVVVKAIARKLITP